MRLLYFVLLLVATGSASPVMAQNSSNDPRIARDTFNPEIHALGRLRAGSVDFLVDKRVLIKSLQIRLTTLDNVETIEKQLIGDADFMVFFGWVSGASYRRYLVAVRLRQDREGYLFADRFFKVCMAREEAVCSDCVLTSAGCRCWANDDAFCGNMVGDEMILTKISTLIQ